MTGPPIEGGAVVVAGGVIRALGAAVDLVRQWPVTGRTEFPGYALLPALVNGHAHLELSALAVPSFEDADFVTWLLRVIEGKRQAAGEEVWQRGVREGVEACGRTGQGTIADVLSIPRAAASYPETGPRIRVYPEVIAPRRAALHPGMERAKEAAAAVAGNAQVWGLSPHAPYTVCAEALGLCREVAQARRWRLMIHLAESHAELELLEGGRGPMADRLYANLPSSAPPTPRCHPLTLLQRERIFDVPTTLIHAVHLDPAKHIPHLLAGHVGVVLCPRSNRNLGVGVAPGRALLDAGVPVGLGTDSILSAGSLDLWQDVAAAVEDYQWTPEEALMAATLGSARVHGLEPESGSLAPGRRADLLAVQVGAGRQPWEGVLREGGPHGVWLAGERYR